MKKFCLLLLILVMALTVTPVHAQTSTPPPRLNGYNAQINHMLSKLSDFQVIYRSANDKYFQGLRSHSAVPGSDTALDRLTGKPTDQADDLAAFWAAADMPPGLSWSFVIDVYSGPSGDGYVLTASANIDGVIWLKAINVGPETWRDHDWSQAVAP